MNYVSKPNLTSY